MIRVGGSADTSVLPLDVETFETALCHASDGRARFSETDRGSIMDHELADLMSLFCPWAQRLNSDGWR